MRTTTTGVHRTSPAQLLRLCALALLTMSFASGTARAQSLSPAEQRREIERLRAENDALRRALADTRALLDDLRLRLEGALATLADLGAPGTRGTDPAPSASPDRSPPTPGPRAVSPAAADLPPDAGSNAPFVSPDALLRALQRDYTERLAAEVDAARADEADRSTTDDAALDPSTPPDPAVVLGFAEAWVAATPARFTSLIEWVVRLEVLDDQTPVPPTTARTDDRRAVPTALTILDPRTGESVSGPHLVPLPARIVGRLTPGIGGVYALDGQITASPVFNPTRATPGPFNFPPLVGPYVEFGYTLDCRQAVPADLPTPGQAAPGGQVGSPGTNEKPMNVER